MTVFICLDDRGGMTFLGKRLSRDAAVIADVLAFSDGKLSVHPYSLPLFGGAAEAREDYLNVGENCFVEREELKPHLGRITRLVVYRWNRHYPSDRVPDIDPAAEGFVLKETSDFPGTSHEKITREVYEK